MLMLFNCKGLLLADFLEHGVAINAKHLIMTVDDNYLMKEPSLVSISLDNFISLDTLLLPFKQFGITVNELQLATNFTSSLQYMVFHPVTDLL